MAGSLKAMVYESDYNGGGTGTTAQKYLVFVDESNGTALGFADANTPADLALPQWPRKWKMRTVTLTTTSGTGAAAATYNRQVKVGVRTHPAFFGGGTVTMQLYPGSTGAGATWNVLGAQGEDRSYASTADTGLTDGTAT